MNAVRPDYLAGKIPVRFTNSDRLPLTGDFEINGDEVTIKIDNWFASSSMKDLILNGLIEGVEISFNYVVAVPARGATAIDYMPSLGEDVRSDAMETGFEPHADGRVCSKHHRLGKYTPDGLNECLRPHIKNHNPETGRVIET